MLTIVTPKEIIPEAEAFFVEHGCHIEPHNGYSEITFPEGTARTEILPRMPGGERYRLVLPDGCIAQQTYVRYLEQSMLHYSYKCPSSMPQS